MADQPTDPYDRTLGPHTTVLMGARQGTYPHGNSLLVAGSDRTVLIDPSIAVHDRRPFPWHVDQVVLSHVHEDHIGGLAAFPDAAVAAHRADLVGLGGLEGLLQIYGYPLGHLPDFERMLIEDFHVVARPDATGLEGGEVLDLGGVSVEVVHLPGHTRGHCGLHVRPDDVLYLGDIDLTGFGPYYGDAWSDLADFERSLERCRQLEAGAYVTFHHKGVIDDRAAFLAQLEAFAAVIPRREASMLAYLAEPRRFEELVAHRFVYRPHVELDWVDLVERRSAEQHLARFLADGRVAEVAPATYVAR